MAVNAEHLPDWPRLLNKELAAAYIGVSIGKLDKLPISPVRIGSRVVYDRRSLDRWADNLGGHAQPDDPLDELLDRL